MGVVADALPNPPDTELLRQFVRTRDDLAFGRLMARHSRPVRRIAYRFTQSHPAADDVTQAAFLVLLKRPRPALRSAKRRGSLLPWLAKVARYAAANWRRADAIRRRRERAAPVRNVPYDPTALSAGVELAEAVRSALSCLPRRDRRIVEWRHLSQMPWDEVARQAGTTPEAARKAGTRALSQLRVVLEKRGITAGGAAVLAGLRAMTVPAQSSAATVTVTLSPTQLAQGVLTMFKVQTSAITAAALLTAGVTTAAALMQDSEPPVTRGAASSGWTASLSDGTTVKLLAMGDQEGDWWMPDGEATGVPEQAPESLLAAPGGQRQLVFAVEVSRGDLGLEDVRFDSSGVIGSVSRTPPGEGPVRFLTAMWVTSTGTGDLFFAIGVPLGQPEIIGTVPADQGGQVATKDGVAVGLSRVGQYRSGTGGQETFVTVFAPEADATHFAVTLTTDDGQKVHGVPHLASAGAQSPMTYRFGSVPLDRVRELTVAASPVETVRFLSLADRVGDASRPVVRVVGEPSFRVPPGPHLDEELGNPRTYSGTLSDVLDSWRNGGIVVTLDPDGVATGRIDPSTPINLSFPATLTKGEALELIGRSAGLRLVIKDKGPMERRELMFVAEVREGEE